MSTNRNNQRQRTSTGANLPSNQKNYKKQRYKQKVQTRVTSLHQPTLRDTWIKERAKPRFQQIGNQMWDNLEKCCLAISVSTADNKWIYFADNKLSECIGDRQIKEWCDNCVPELMQYFRKHIETTNTQLIEATNIFKSKRVELEEKEKIEAETQKKMQARLEALKRRQNQNICIQKEKETAKQKQIQQIDAQISSLRACLQRWKTCNDKWLTHLQYWKKMNTLKYKEEQAKYKAIFTVQIQQEIKKTRARKKQLKEIKEQLSG
eukprot:277759_1